MDEDTRLSKGERDFLLSELEKITMAFIKMRLEGLIKVQFYF